MILLVHDFTVHDLIGAWFYWCMILLVHNFIGA